MIKHYQDTQREAENKVKEIILTEKTVQLPVRFAYTEADGAKNHVIYFHMKLGEQSTPAFIVETPDDVKVALKEYAAILARAHVIKASDRETFYSERVGEILERFGGYQDMARRIKENVERAPKPEGIIGGHFDSLEELSDWAKGNPGEGLQGEGVRAKDAFSVYGMVPASKTYRQQAEGTYMEQAERYLDSAAYLKKHIKTRMHVDRSAKREQEGFKEYKGKIYHDKKGRPYYKAMENNAVEIRCFENEGVPHYEDESGRVYYKQQETGKFYYQDLDGKMQYVQEDNTHKRGYKNILEKEGESEEKPVINMFDKPTKSNVR